MSQRTHHENETGNQPTNADNGQNTLRAVAEATPPADEKDSGTPVGTAPAAQGVTGKRADDDDDDVPPPVAPRTGPIMPEFTSNCPVSPEGLLYIKLEPDERGRFGFNVKGGVDQNLPVVISKVTPNTPAATVIPRLIDADQVLFINGTSVSDRAHEQVVQLIRETRNLTPCELDLIVKPATAIHWRIPNAEEYAQAAMEQLRVHLEFRVHETQFENLYRKTPGLTQKEGTKPENASKNRYLDILPYDHTRVVLLAGENSYINANFVNMDLPHTNQVNKYIASQGTLEHTVRDFWQMIWEQGVKLVVMLTNEYEDQKLKCFRYWPEVGETATYGQQEVKCEEMEEIEDICTIRQLILKDLVTNYTRQVEQLQFTSWPDHDTPNDCHGFLKFVQLVQQRRAQTEEPESILVHCSAGVGRTGVFILVDTALCMLQTTVSVFPLDLLRIIRDQRPMMIQNASQYEFACTTILKAYDEDLYHLPSAETEAVEAAEGE